MPNLVCATCNKDFYITNKNFKYVISNIHNFCSVKCLHEYLTQFRWEKRKENGVKKSITPKFSTGDLQYYPNLGLSLRSKYEYLVASFLKKFSISFEYEKYILRFNNKIYIPDFYLPDLDVYLEVKGIWRRGSKKKIKHWYNLINLTVIPYYLKKDFFKFLS